MTALPANLQNLLEAAEAEAKRTGHATPSVLHLTAALRRSNRDAFAAVLGDGAEERLRLALRPGGVDTRNSPSPSEILAEAAKLDSSPAGVLSLLKPHFETLAPPAEAGSTQSASDSGPKAQAETADTGAGAPPSPSGAGWFTELVETIAPDPTILGRNADARALLAILGRRTPGLPCVFGTAGVGRTSLLAALAALIAADSAPKHLAGRRVLRVIPEKLLVKGRANALQRILDNARDAILAIDDLEVVAALGGRGCDMAMLGVIRSAIGRPELPLLLTMDAAYRSRLAGHDSELYEEIEPYELSELGETDLRAIAAAHAERLGRHHGVTYPDEVIAAALAPRAPDERAHPGLLVDRLDHAGAVAALFPTRVAAVDSLRLQAPAPLAGGLADLAERMRRRVRGQDQAVDTIAARLALTRAQLDLRPERPDGVFLFAGPTGVGKTALARTLCHELFGDEQRLIRLDMSEFMHEWAITRLIGPSPGYVGSTEPDEWLTTRVRRQPNSVVLLDEVEKAHPRIWNTFLQVFDAGRLSDLQGEVSFADTIIVLTTNMGADKLQANPLGFGATANDEDERTVGATTELRRQIPPELVNRLDAIVMFQALSPQAIREIAEMEIDAMIRRLSERGYRLEIEDGVIDHIASTGYDRAYGARHLQRNIEKLLLETLVTKSPGSYLANLESDGAIRWSQRDEG